MDKNKILEFGVYFSGPLLGFYLANLGCQVISIKKPEINNKKELDRMGELYKVLNQDKIVKNIYLPNPDIYKYIQESNIIIENYGQTIMTKLGVDFKTCLMINPNIIYVSLPAFVPNDNDFSYIKSSYESIIMASCGVFSDMGLNRTLLGIKASYSGLNLSSVYGSIFGLCAVLAAIYAKKEGEFIEVPLASCLSEAMVHNSIEFGKDKSYMNLRSRRILENNYPIDNLTLKKLFDPFFCIYNCQDNRPFYLVCPAHYNHQLKALNILNIKDEVLKIVSFKNAYNDDGSYGLGCGYLTEEQTYLIKPLFENSFLTKKSDEWEIIFGELGVPGIKIRSTSEWCKNQHVNDSGLFCPLSRKISNIGWFSDSYHIPIDKIQSVDKTNNKYCLSNIKVVDLTNVIAGPTIGTILARFGAEVIKIDPPSPTYAPDISVFYGLATNIGKQSILLDIYDSKGYEILKKILKNTDIIIVNCNHKCLERMKLTKKDILEINPNLILAHFDAWGGPKNKGYMNNFNGYDDCIQASTGIMERFGGGIHSAEEHAHIGTIDVIAGVCGAALSIAGLIERDSKSINHVVRTSLAAVGQFLQLPWIFNVNRSTNGIGQNCKGEHLLHSCYQTKDGWFLLMASFNPNNEIILNQIKNIINAKKLDSKSFLEYNVNQICYLFNKHNISCCPLKSMIEIRNSNLVQSCNLNSKKTFQFLQIKDHPIGSLIIVAPTAIRMSGINVNLGNAPKYGKDTQYIINSLKIDYPINCISFSWSRTYIPFVTPCQKCNQKGRKRYVLFCQHTLCITCTNFYNGVCPICKIEHSQSKIMKQTLEKTRKQYRDWRLGYNKGNKDVEFIYRPTKIFRKSQSLPNLVNDSQFNKCASCVSFETLSIKQEKGLHDSDL